MRIRPSSSSPHGIVTAMKYVIACCCLVTSLNVQGPSDDSQDIQQDGIRDPVIDSCKLPLDVEVKICQERPVTLVKTILNAKILLYGRVIKTYRDKRVEQNPQFNVYTAEMQVHCVLKGELTEAVVNISEAGYVPSRCYYTNLTAGWNYVVVIYPIGDHLCTVDREINATQEQLTEVMKACDLNPRYPNGVTKDTATAKCPEPTRHPECIGDYSTTTVTQSEGENSYDEYYGGEVLIDINAPHNNGPEHRSFLAAICILVYHLI